MLYRKDELSRDDRGYVRYLGRTSDGKQAKFRLGADENKARLAAARLSLLWSRLESQGRTWGHATLLLAKAIAKGEMEVTFSHPTAEDNVFAATMTDLNNQYGDIIRVVPANAERFERGQKANDELAALVLEALPKPAPLVSLVSGTLHDALNDFRLHLVEHPDHSGHFRNCMTAVDRLKERHPDFPLSDMGEAAMWQMLEYWAKRPTVKGKQRPISRHSAQYHIKRLREFWRWLHRSEKYSWRKPDGWEDMRVKITNRPEDREKKAKALLIDTFKVAELKLLYRHSIPLVRAFMLLALNCGFKLAELATLTRAELFLDAVHPDAEMIGTHLLKSSWIRRLRGKTDVYSEWELWPETTAAVRWALVRAGQIGERDLIFVTEMGRPYNAKTKGGNKPNRIANLWNETLLKSGLPQDRRLSFKHLKKTAATIIRKHYGAEIAGMYECHGTVSKTDTLADIYANRPWAKLFEALTHLRQELAPMFKE
ncbi:MAG: hypothetical protein JNM56_11435 [Planctomycetia bacterium]|nr:hypothetical protein [Planctomycetia bacterium]